MKYKSPNVALQDELLYVTWTSQLRTGQPSIFAFKFGVQPTVSYVLQNWSTRQLVIYFMTSYPFFSRWRLAAILDLIWAVLDHPWSEIVGLSLLLKFGLDHICSFEILRFLYLPFWLEIAYLRPFLGVLVVYFIQMWLPIVLTPQRTIPARKHVVWAIKRENRSSGST